MVQNWLKIWEFQNELLKYHQVVRRHFLKNYNWEDFETLADVTAKLESIQRLPQLKMELIFKKDAFKAIIYDDKYDPAARKLFTESDEYRYKNWKNGDIEKVFTNFDLEDAREELDRLQALVNKRSELKDLLSNYSSAVRRLYSQSNEWKGYGNLETFFKPFNKVKAKEELNRIQELLEKKSALKDLLEEYSTIPGVRRMYTEKNNWKGQSLEDVKDFFTTFELGKAREDLESLKSEVTAVREWKKSVMKQYNTLDDKTVQLLQKAGKKDILDAAKETKTQQAANMTEGERFEISDNLSELISNVDGALEVWNDCLQEQGLNQDWNLEDLLPEDSKFSVCLEEFANVL